MTPFLHGRLTFVLLAGSLLAGGQELVTLKSGFQLRIKAHRQVNGLTQLDTGSGELTLGPDEVLQIDVCQPDSPAADPLAPDSPAPDSPAIERLVETVSRAQGLPPAFVRSVALIESGLKNDALSRKGARGLMQLMPATARDLQVDATLPADNVLGGVRYLRQLLVRYRGDAARALAAYNAGPGAVAQYAGVPPFQETQRYIARVLNEYKKRQASEAKAAAALTIRSK